MPHSIAPKAAALAVFASLLLLIGAPGSRRDRPGIPAAHAQAPLPRYQVTFVGLPAGAQGAVVTDIAGDGSICGEVMLGGGIRRAFRFGFPLPNSLSAAHFLNPLPGAVSSFATGITIGGGAVGVSQTANFDTRAVFWPAGSANPVDLVGLSNGNTFANAISANGLAIGDSATQGPPQAFIVDTTQSPLAPQRLDVGADPNFVSTSATSISDDGNSVTIRRVDPRVSEDVHVIIDRLASTVLQLPPFSGDAQASVRSVNNSGRSVGASLQRQGLATPVIWDSSGAPAAAPFNPPAPGVGGSLNAINNLGDYLGTFGVFPNTACFARLDSQLAPNLAGLFPAGAIPVDLSDINDNRVIVGTAVPSPGGLPTPCVLTPQGPSGNADVSVSITVPPVTGVNRTSTGTIRVQNRGPDPAQDVRVDVESPTFARLVRFATARGVTLVQQSDQEATLTAPSLARGRGFTTRFQVQNTQIGTGSIDVQYSSSTGDPNPANNSASAPIRSSGPDLVPVFLRPTFFPPGRGNRLDARVRVRNSGRGDSGPFSVQIVLAAPGPPPVRTTLGDYAVENLRAGQQTVVGGSFTPPQNVDLNVAFIEVVVDPTNEVPEDNESNNELIEQIWIRR